MGPWVAVAAGITAVDVALVKTGRPTLSAVWWGLLENPTTRPLPVGAWATVTYHLARPRRRWAEALEVGTLAAAVTVAYQERIGRGTC